MRAKNLALRVLSTAAMLSIVTSIAAPAFAATYYINDGSVDVTVSEDGVVTVEQGDVTYKDGLGSVVIRGGTRGNKDDDRVKADASPATQEADGSNAPGRERDGSAQEREYRRGRCTEAGNHSRRGAQRGYSAAGAHRRGSRRESDPGAEAH